MLIAELFDENADEYAECMAAAMHLLGLAVAPGSMEKGAQVAKLFAHLRGLPAEMARELAFECLIPAR